MNTSLHQTQLHSTSKHPFMYSQKNVEGKRALSRLHNAHASAVRNAKSVIDAGAPKHWRPKSANASRRGGGGSEGLHVDVDGSLSTRVSHLLVSHNGTSTQNHSNNSQYNIHQQHRPQSANMLLGPRERQTKINIGDTSPTEHSTTQYHNSRAHSAAARNRPWSAPLGVGASTPSAAAAWGAADGNQNDDAQPQATLTVQTSLPSPAASRYSSRPTSAGVSRPHSAQSMHADAARLLAAVPSPQQQRQHSPHSQDDIEPTASYARPSTRSGPRNILRGSLTAAQSRVMLDFVDMLVDLPQPNAEEILKMVAEEYREKNLLQNFY
eukprot:PhM_4_TR11980/c0_g1_i1/m.13156